jgi:hypothetical protein
MGAHPMRLTSCLVVGGMGPDGCSSLGIPKPVKKKTLQVKGGRLALVTQRSPRRRRGPVERKVRADIASVMTAHPMGEALAEMSYNLARALDDGAGLATAAVNRELRANLTELARLAVNDSDDLADELSAPVRDTPEPG